MRKQLFKRLQPEMFIVLNSLGEVQRVLTSEVLYVLRCSRMMENHFRKGIEREHFHVRRVLPSFADHWLIVHSSLDYSWL